MKKIKMNIKQLAGVLGGLLLLSSPMGFVSCKEEIDESNFAIKSEMTAADFIDADPNFSMIKSIFQQVRLGNSDDASPIYSVLTARGNYTIFLPTDDAIRKFMTENGVPTFDSLLNNKEYAELLAMNCIIDNGDEDAYDTPLFDMQGGAFPKANLNDRELTSKFDTATTSYFVNITSQVIDEDNEVSNGYIHVVSTAVAPSALTLDRLIGEADNLKVFTYLLKTTTLADSLHDHLDNDYYDPNRELTFKLPEVDIFNNIKDRYLGYTAFVETDTVYQKEFGLKVELNEKGELANGSDFIAALTPLAQAVYGNAHADDLTHPDNAINRFVAYHLLKGKMSKNKLVHHYNEFGYDYVNAKNPKLENMPTNVWDFYTTMGKHPCLLKVTQLGNLSEVIEDDPQSYPLFLNRISTFNNAPDKEIGNYAETGIFNGNRGYRIQVENGDNDNNGLNGYYYTLDQLLFYTDQFRQDLQKHRIRIDVTTMLHELLSNNVRGSKYYHFENGYFENITREAPDTKLLYLMNPSPSGWKDYQGDEFMVSGLYDFTMQLPPVPKRGTYEIRMGVSQNSLRGMCQIYFGDDPDHLIPAGLPYDMRQKINKDKPEPSFPWIADTEDWSINRENDKKFRNQGYMKGPNYFLVCNGAKSEPVRDYAEGNLPAVRRIITVADMDPDKTYYLRFKTALKKTDSQFFMDYFEYAHTSVYNGVEPEDIW